MFDRPFELSFEEGHRQTKIKKDNLDKLNSKDFYQEEFNKEAQKEMDRNSDLVDFERGSTFGGIMTAFVLVGFIGILMYDLQENIINKPYTFVVRDKFMAPEEIGAQSVMMGEGEKSVEMMVVFLALHENGTLDYSFNPLDNDYFDLITSYWDIEKNKEEDKSIYYLREGPKLTLCGKEKERQVLGWNYDPNWVQRLCFSEEKEEVSINGNNQVSKFKTILVNIVACNSTRRSTCKSREQTAAFLKRSVLRVDVLRNIVKEDQFSNEDSESQSRYKGDANSYFPIQY